MRFVPPHRSIMFAPVSGTVDATYLNSWLTDGQPGFPVRTTGSLALTVTPSTAVMTDVIAVVVHNLRQAATIALSGSVTNSIPTAAWPSDGIPLNWLLFLPTPVSVSSLVLSVSGNTDPVIIGELYAGLSSELPDLLAGRRFTPGQLFPWEGEYSSLAPYDPGVAAQRRVSGTVVLTDADYATLLDIYLSQRAGTRPLLWVEDETINDAWLCQMEFTAEHNEGYHFITMEIAEIPRLRWL